MLNVLEETEEGRLEGEPEAKGETDLLTEAVSELTIVRATLLTVNRNSAGWRLDTGEYIEVGFMSNYDVIDPVEFNNWLDLVNKTLQESGRKSDGLSISGSLSISMRGQIVAGWKEDESHPDAMLLSIGETMLA